MLKKFWLLVFVFIAYVPICCGQSDIIITGLDHVPVGVNDLEKAESEYKHLGFTLKPGRFHGDGIRNANVKFINGTGLELITAVNPQDSLATEYFDWLKGGEGAAFWSLYSPNLRLLEFDMKKLSLGPKNDGDVLTFSQTAFPHRFFFADREKSPTDRPEYFSHPNTAYRLEGIWLQGSTSESELLLKLGARKVSSQKWCPFGTEFNIFRLLEGDEIMFVLPSVPVLEARSIFGVSIKVHSLQTLINTLRRNQIKYFQVFDGGAWVVWVPPSFTHGLWLQFSS